MALDRGGACSGVIQRLSTADARNRLRELLRREMSARPSTNCPRWVTVQSAGERLRAITFVANRAGPVNSRPVSPEETAAVLARAVGHWGSCVEYLLQTVRHLEELDIHDRYLWQLQELVAGKIRSIAPPRGGGPA